MSFSYTGLILTHLVTAYIFTFVLVAFALFLSLTEKHLRLLSKFATAYLFSISVSSFYFIPMVFERKFVHIEWLTEIPILDYKQNFLFTNVHVEPLYKHLKHIFVLQIFLLVCSAILICYNRRYRKPDSNHISFLFFLFVFSFFILTPLSMPLWNHIPGLSTIQFPWRWLTISTFTASALIGSTFETFSFKDIKKDRFARILMAVFVALIIANLCISSFYISTAEPMQERDMEWILKDGGDMFEYRPVWLADKRKDFSKEKWIPVTFKEGMGTVDILKWNSESRFFKANASSPSILRISTFYYPGWTALINGRKIPLNVEKDSGAILLNVPPGKNTVLLEFKDTPLRRLAKWISIISLFITFVSLAFGRFFIYIGRINNK